LEKAPARFPSIVVIPAMTPVPAANKGLVGTFSDFMISITTIMITVRIIIIAITFLKTASFISLPAYTPIRIPAAIQGTSFQKCFHCACL
jgi:hypothetical protein